MVELTEELEAQAYAYLTTVGRVSGRPHRIEIWFAIVDGSVWMNSGGRDRSDWVRNLIAEPNVDIEIGKDRWSAVATVHHDLVDHPARRSLAARYQGWRPGQELSSWATDSLLVEIRAQNDR